MDRPGTMKDLLVRARGGDQAAFSAAVERVQPRLEALIEYWSSPRLRCRVLPEEVLQLTILRALRSLDQLTAEEDHDFFRWLACIAKHVINEALRPPVPGDPASDDIERPWTGGSPEEDGPGGTPFERLRVALESLSPDRQQVILLAEIRRLPMEEVARAMERTPQATEALLQRAMDELRLALGRGKSGL